MARAYKCDMYGKFYTDSGLIIPSYDENMTFNRITVLSKSGTRSITFDLCDECLGKVLNMLHVKTIKEEVDAEEAQNK